MIPFSILRADFRRLWAGAFILSILIMAATALNITVSLEERAMRLGSARAAEPFDLIVGAPGSETQLVLSSVFLQPALLPLLPAHYSQRLEQHPLVAWSAPLAFGDFYLEMPIIGTTGTLITQGGQRPLAAGHPFSAPFEAVVGFSTGLKVGETIKPLHGQFGQEGAHAHDKIIYTVVGMLPKQNNAWDKAILVPIETIWHVHDIEEDSRHDDDDPDIAVEDHPYQNLAHKTGVSAIVVKPKSVAGAYQLRTQFRSGNSIAVFPAEVLTRLYGLLGNVRHLLSVIAWGTQLLVGLCVILVAVVHVNQRKRQIAALRAFGAPRHALFIVVWFEFVTLVLAGIAAGMLLGYWAAQIISTQIAAQSGFALPVEMATEDWWNMLQWLVIATAASLAPAALIYRHSPAQALRD
ncbi:membrane protein [Betaproteobacteria bacterium]|nr:membrane protein [Betaproteobacteria bacterium]GHU48656.1 membrane protein [Betaproteobacteria bacterium]